MDAEEDPPRNGHGRGPPRSGHGRGPPGSGHGRGPLPPEVVVEEDQLRSTAGQVGGMP